MQQMVGWTPIEAGDWVVVREEGRPGTVGAACLVEDVLFVQSQRHAAAWFLYKLAGRGTPVPLSDLVCRVVDGEPAPLRPERTAVREVARHG